MIQIPGNPSKQGETTIVPPATIKAIKNFLLDAVLAWCNANGQNSGNWFSARDFLGEDNKDWDGTPYLDIYNAYVAAGKTHNEAKRQAGIDIGHLLFNALLASNRKFGQRRGYKTAEYTWV